jgi:hypothetical protein
VKGQARQNKTSQPPQFVSTIKLTGKRLRWTGNANPISSKTITNINIFDMLFMDAFDAVAGEHGYRLLNAIKLKEIHIYFNSNAGNNAVTASIEWLNLASGGIGSNSVIDSMSVLGTAEVGHLVSKPPKGATSSQWLSSVAASENLFTVKIPGSLCTWFFDLVFDASICDVDAGSTVANAPTVANPGQIYMRGLDGALPATSVFTPVSYLAA